MLSMGPDSENMGSEERASSSDKNNISCSLNMLSTAAYVIFLPKSGNRYKD